MSVSPTFPPATPAAPRALAAIILAAGKGKRMNSDLPKVVHAVAGAPMVRWVVQACREAGASPIVLVIGHGAESVREAFRGDDRDIRYAVQAEQLGTGHATQCAKPALGEFDGDVLVLAGDGPLIRVQTITAMHRRHVETRAVATIATSVIPDPTGYGRIVRESGGGGFGAIVEHRNATPQQREIREVYPSYACFDAARLFEALADLKTDAVSGEYYLTDVFAMLKQRGHRVEVIEAVPPEDVLSINDPQQLAEVDAILRRRITGSPLSSGDGAAPSRRPSPEGRGNAHRMEVTR